jgi:hypothetical protein
MKLPIITLTQEEPEQEVAALAGQSIGAGHYDRSVAPSTIYLKPNGQFLCLWLKKVIPPSLQRDALRVLNHKEIARPGSAKTRGKASGNGADPKAGSSILGSFDREGRHHPYGRKAAFNRRHPRLFKQFVPYIEEVDRLYEQYLREIYNSQYLVALATWPEWLVGDSVFTTIQVNKGFRTQVHKDGNNLHSSVAPMTCFTNASGGELIFPKYRVAVPYSNGDLLLANVHEWHGNAPFRSDPKKCFRTTCVFYFRARMVQCGTQAEEVERMRDRKVGDPLFGWIIDGKFITPEEQQEMAARYDDEE